MDKLTHEEKRIYYEEVVGEAAEKPYEFLKLADEIVDDMETPLGKKIMQWLDTELRKAGLVLEKSIHSDSPVTETERIEYKNIQMLVTRLDELVSDREIVTQRIRDKIKIYFGLDKADKV